VPANSGHHHREPHPRKVYGSAGGPAPAGNVPHTYQAFDGWAGCSCGAWTRTGSEFVTRPQHRVHVAEARAKAKAKPSGRKRRKQATMPPHQQLVS